MMKDINQITLSGKATKLHPYKGKMPVVRIEMNVTGNREEVIPVKAVTFGEMATYVGRQVKEGDRIFVIGSLRMNAYKMKDGKESRSLEIHAQGVVVCKDVDES